MSKLNNRYWLETEDFFIGTGMNTEKINEGILLIVFPYTNSPLITTTPTKSRLEFFPQNIFSKKPT